MATLSTIKTHGLAKSSKPTAVLIYETPPWNVGDPKPVHIQGLPKVEVGKPLKQSQNGSIYRLNLSKSKQSKHVFRLCSIFNLHETEKQQGSRKHHYDDTRD